MTTDVWPAIRDRADSLDPDAVLVTPDDEDVFVVARAGEDRVVVEFRDGGERTLRRDQFAVLTDQLRDGPLPIRDQPPGVAPYVTLLSLAPGVVVDADEGTLRFAEGGDGEDASGGADADDVAASSPFVRSRWDVRRPPETVHDDAVLAADFLERRDATDPAALDDHDLVDLYVLLSDLQWGADDLRRTVGDELLERVGPEGRLHGQYGSVSRARREYRRLKDEDEVLRRLDEASVPREWVLGVDEEKLDVVLAATEVEETDVYEFDETYHVQKTDVESDEKRTRLQGLRDRLDAVDDDRAEEIRDEIETLEARIDDAIAAD